MKLNNSKQSPFGLKGGNGVSRGGFRRAMRQAYPFIGETIISIFLRYALCAMLFAGISFPQSENTISNDGTTNHFWYVGKDSSARLGVGVPHKQPLSNNLTLGDSLSMGSQTYHPGWAGDGWKIEKDTSEYTLYIDNLNIRGTLSASELLINQVRAVNGNLLVSSAAKVDSVTVLPVQPVFKVEDITGHAMAPFLPGDIIMCQVINSAGASFNGSGDVVNNQYLVKRLIFKVDSVNGLKVYKSNLPGAPANKGIIKKGDTFVRIGSTSNSNRRGIIGLFTDEPGAPFIQIKDKVNSWSAWKSDTTTRVYLGNLNEISDSSFGGQLEGYGLYSNNAYIKGKIIVTNPEDFKSDMKWDSLKNKPSYFNAPAGQGLFISGTNMGYYNSITYPASPWRTYIDSLGRFYLAGNSTNYLSWDGSTLNINGNITLTNTIPLAKVSGAGVLAGANSLDNVPDGTSYAKVLKTDIQSGHIKLSSVVGSIDDISNGTMYGKVLLTDIQSGHIKLSEAVGSLDDIEEGTTYGRVLKTDISSGHIKLSETVGTLDDIDNGIAYGKVLSTEIDAGHIKIVGSDNSTTVISGGKIQSGSIKADDIAVGAITVTKLAAGTANKTVRSAESPATANVGDLWIDIIDGDRPYTWNGTGWIPAYSSISGGTIKTGTITASQLAAGAITTDKIAAGSITTDKLVAGTLTGFTMQTSSSGQRVVVSGSTNTIEYYKTGDVWVGSITGGTTTGLGDGIVMSGRVGFSDDISISGGSQILGLVFPTITLGPISYGSSSGWRTVGYFDALGYKVNGAALSYTHLSGFPSISGQAGKFLTNNGSALSWTTISGSGTLTSVGLSTGVGLTVSSSTTNPITSTGTFTVGVQSGYTMPTTSQVTNWDNKVSFPGFGTSGSTACVGNDSRLSDSRPASDVYAWAKGSSKPSYTFSEIGSKPTTLNGYGITDAASSTHSHAFSSITSKPNSLSGYGISDTYYGSLGQANLYVASTSGGAATTRLQYYPVTIGGTLHYLLVY